MALGGGDQLAGSIVINTLSVTQKGEDFLESAHAVSLPWPASLQGQPSNIQKTEEEPKSAGTKSRRETKGNHALPMIKKLMQSKENWFLVDCPEDYHFPGVFSHDYPKRMGYCEDITTLSNYTPTDPDFLYKDIQIGKGKARGNRTIKMDVDGAKEKVTYKLVPCNGVKMCLADGCNHVVPTWEIRPCLKHKCQPLTRSTGCPVEFIYIRPENEADNRRWITGIDRCSGMKSHYLHNHPLHADAKIPEKVKGDIQKAVIKNPGLKTKDIIEGMNY